MTSSASVMQMKGELREAKRRLDCENDTPRRDGWVIAFSASGMRPRKALCHETVLLDDEAGEVGSGGST